MSTSVVHYRVFPNDVLFITCDDDSSDRLSDEFEK